MKEKEETTLFLYAQKKISILKGQREKNQKKYMKLFFLTEE